MGQVFEAEHTGLRRRVAVKLLGAAVAGDPIFIDRLRLEGQALASIRHPNVVLIHDHATTPDGAPFLVMELLRGRTLHDLLRERRAIGLPEALHLFDQILGGLAAIHAAGLTHRDLKPANIFLCDEGDRTTVKLLDFGIVKITRNDLASSIAPLRHPTAHGQTIGTPRFMAPEQVFGRDCDARTDIYASAVLLYLMLSGRDPFHHHRSEVAILTAQAMEQPRPLSEVAGGRIPPGVDATIARALAKDPAERFASVAEFGAALSAGVSGPPRLLRGLPTVTEKMAARPWAADAKTAPLDVAVFRDARSALPFAPRKEGDGFSAEPAAPRSGPAYRGPSSRMLRPPPRFGLPPLSPVPQPLVAPLPPPEVPNTAPAPAADVPHEPRAPEDNRRLFALVALLWCLVAAVAWRVL